MEKQTRTTGFDQLSQTHLTLFFFKEPDRDRGSGGTSCYQTRRLDPECIAADWSPRWERTEKAGADLWKYYFICRASQWAWLSVIMLQFHITCLSKPHKSLMVLQGSLAIVAAWHQAKDDKPQDKFPSSSVDNETFELELKAADVDGLLRAEEMSLWWRGWRAGLLTIVDLAWKTLFIAALMAPPNQAWLGLLNKYSLHS